MYIGIKSSKYHGKYQNYQFNNKSRIISKFLET